MSFAGYLAGSSAVVLAPHALFDHVKGFLADIMLDLAGVIGRRFAVHTQAHQKLGENIMALEYFLGDEDPRGCQKQVALIIDRHVARVTQYADRSADAGLGKIHVLGDIDGMNRLSLLG